MLRISPRVDVAFKKIFGVEQNKDLLISLINSIVSLEDQVSDVTLLNPYNAQNFSRDKLSILDKSSGVIVKLLIIFGFNLSVKVSNVTLLSLIL